MTLRSHRPELRDSTEPLFGRDALRERLDGPSAARCVSLVGTGGVGKTRLARAARPNALFVDLSRAVSGAELCDTIARAAGFTLDGSGPPEVTLAGMLAARGMDSLVLDNCEQLESTAPARVEGLLRHFPGLRVLVTSRQALEIAEEEVIAVPALDLAAAVGLFLARGWAAGLVKASPGPAAAAQWATVQRIVAHLEGLPLALELAAARLEVLALDELERLLTERFSALRDPSDPGRRHGTLWQTIDWSWRLLSPAERAALAQASVFEAGFRLADAEVIFRLPDSGDGDPPSPLDALQSLCRKHLITPSVSRPTVFRLAESIRAFAARKLAAEGDPAEVRHRHAAHFLARGSSWAALAHGPRMLEMLDAVQAMYPELRHIALAGSPDERRAAVHACLPYLATREPPRNQVALIDAALEGQPAELAVEARIVVGELLDARGMAARFLGRHDEAEVDYRRALALAQETRNARLEGLSEGRLGALCHARGRFAEATVHLERAEACLHAAGDRRNEAVMIGAQALLSLAATDFPGAVARCERALELLTEVGDARQAGIVHGFLATTFAEHGETGRALLHNERALAAHEAFGNLRPEAVARGQRGIILQVEGRLAEARADLERALAVVDALGDPRMGGSLRIYRGLLALEAGEAGADAWLAEGLSRTMAANDRGFLGIARVSQAAPPALVGEVADTEAKLAALGEALSHAYTPHVLHLPEVYRALAAVSAALRSAANGLGTDERTARDAARALDARLSALPSYDLAIGLRLLRGALSALDAAESGWHIERAGRQARMPTGEIVDLSRRLPLARLLAALLEARLGRPGSPVPRSELVALAWPDEPRLRIEAARNRLNVALSTLRGLGLAPLIETAGEGHRLSTAINVLPFDLIEPAGD